LRPAYARLHIAVILLAATAILGALISQSATVLIWWRTLIAFMGLLVYLLISKKLRWDWVRDNRKIYVLGAMVAVHWICFFGSIKLANAATALLCFATITIFTAMIEPLITGRKRETHEIVFGLMVIPGIVLIAGKAQGDLMLGIILGIIASLLVSVF
jgi:drug/metabolite transporter (DMT)-like permease